MKKVAIIDDEQPARTLLREYLNDYPDLVIIGEANNGVDAIRVIQEFQPEIVFMDIQMPGMNGFEVLNALREVPLIIFSTAYDQTPRVLWYNSPNGPFANTPSFYHLRPPIWHVHHEWRSTVTFLPRLFV